MAVISTACVVVSTPICCCEIVLQHPKVPSTVSSPAEPAFSSIRRTASVLESLKLPHGWSSRFAASTVLSPLCSELCSACSESSLRGLHGSSGASGSRESGAKVNSKLGPMDVLSSSMYSSSGVQVRSQQLRAVWISEGQSGPSSLSLASNATSASDARRLQLLANSLEGATVSCKHGKGMAVLSKHGRGAHVLCKECASAAEAELRSSSLRSGSLAIGSATRPLPATQEAAGCCSSSTAFSASPEAPQLSLSLPSLSSSSSPSPSPSSSLASSPSSSSDSDSEVAAPSAAPPTYPQQAAPAVASFTKFMAPPSISPDSESLSAAPTIPFAKSSSRSASNWNRSATPSSFPRQIWSTSAACRKHGDLNASAALGRAPGSLARSLATRSRISSSQSSGSACGSSLVTL
mmetsp:Transcript_78293/g.175490  ORF Transcript_78293/g.175490 Transcript_78293/m.175490 type:complete len:407 (-) Transcript_78293:799-2019(-)